MVRRTTRFSFKATRRLPRRIRPLDHVITPPGPSRSLPIKKAAVDTTVFKTAAQAANMTPADIVRGHGLYGDVNKAYNQP